MAHCFQSIQETGVTVNLINFERGVNILNSSPDKLYNFNIPSNFTNNTVFEFELIYFMRTGFNLTIDDKFSFYKFQCSFVIYEEDEEDLISNDSNTVDLSKFKPHFPLKKSH